MRGAFNAVAPEPVTNREFTKTLGKVLRRPTIAPTPAFVLRLAFGEMADAVLLASSRVSPRALVASGYIYTLPNLEEALRFECGEF
jgi:NAD dependent epimerase/dehydratase family enzyme